MRLSLSASIFAASLFPLAGLALAQDAGEPSALAPIVSAIQAPVKAAGGGSNLDAMIARHAATHNLPPALVRRVVMRESRGKARAISKGNYGIMQIRLGTARAMGYRGDAAGLLDADTNMTYAVKYLAGAYRAGGGNQDRAVSLYARGYYYEAKRQGFNAYASADTTGSVAASAATPGGPKSASAAVAANGDTPTITAGGRIDVP